MVFFFALLTMEESCLRKLIPRENAVKLEHAQLAFWEESQVFKKLRDKNSGGPVWSFLDGPITANNPMAVHHAWGRSLKDCFSRFHAMLGCEQRYQNGFDCQGLWVEVEVEKELGFKTKRDIERVWGRQFCGAVQGTGQEIRRNADAAVDPPGVLDGLGRLVLHDVGCQQLHDLVVSEEMP